MPKGPMNPERATFEILVSQYRADPQLLDRHLPEVSQIVRQVAKPTRASRPHFNLTEREKAYHVKELSKIRGADAPAAHQAVQALEHCAVLIEDDFMTPHVNHQLVNSLFKSAFGKSPGSVRKNTIFPIRESVEPIYHVSLVRGVVADLDVGMQLVSITVTSRKVRERSKMMRIVGIGNDSRTDVSVRHDDYLAEKALHGSS